MFPYYFLATEFALVDIELSSHKFQAPLSIARISQSGAITTLAFNSPLAVVFNQHHFVALPPPLVHFAGSWHPDIFFVTQCGQVTQ